PLNLDVLVLNPLHERQLLVLRRHGRVPVGGILEAQRKSRLDRRTALAGDALVLDDEMPRHLAIQRMQLKGQALVAQLLLEIGIGAAGLAHQATQHPEKKAEFHVVFPTDEERSRIVAARRNRKRALRGENRAVGSGPAGQSRIYPEPGGSG